MSSGAQWLEDQISVDSAARRKPVLGLLNELRASIEPGVYELSNDAGGAPRLYVRVAKIEREHSSGDRQLRLTYLWLLAAGEEIPVKSTEMQTHILGLIAERGKKLSS